MKKKISISLILFTLFLNIQSQNIIEYNFSLNTKSQYIDLEDFKENHKNNISTSLKKYLEGLIIKNIDFYLLNEVSSLTGTHYTFQITYEGYDLEKCFLKVHTDKKETAYKISHNLSKEIVQNLPLLSSPFPTKSDFNFDIKNTTISTQKIVLFFDNNEEAKFALKTTFYDEQNGIYREQFSTLEKDVFENDLRVFSDSTVTGKAFLPDPLSSSGNVYGGAYIDGLSKDTTVIQITAIENTGQNPIQTGTINYSIFNQTFEITNQTFTNTYTSDSVYFYFSALILDGDYSIIGYNTLLTDDISALSTQLTFQDYDHATLNNERQDVATIADFDGTDFRLKNDYFQVLDFEAPNILPVTSSTPNFDFMRSQSGFEDFNAFFHLNSFQDHLQDLGFTDLSDFLIIDTHGNNGSDNSYFTPVPSIRISYGEGGVDDAEDADVVIHEYGHAISHMASPNSNIGAERKALDEGFGDYLATSYSKSIVSNQSEKVFTWDGHNEFWGGRFSDLTRLYTDYSASQNIYYNGAIWSATMMDLQNRIGRTIADQLVIEVMHYNMPNSTMLQTALELFTVDSILFNKAHFSDIEEVLCSRAFIEGDCDLVTVYDLQDENSSIQVLNTIGFSNGTSATILFETQPTNATIWLFTIDGKLVFKTQNTQASYTLYSDKLTSGVYFLQVESKSKRFATQLIKH